MCIINGRCPYHLGIGTDSQTYRIYINIKFSKNQSSRFGRVWQQTMWHENFIYKDYTAS